MNSDPDIFAIGGKELH